MLVEYKLFEPGFYHTDIADWGMAYVFCQRCGDRAQVLVDLGHHARSVNIEHIVAFLLDEGRLGGFHFNDARYADDDRSGRRGPRRSAEGCCRRRCSWGRRTCSRRRPRR